MDPGWNSSFIDETNRFSFPVELLYICIVYGDVYLLRPIYHLSPVNRSHLKTINENKSLLQINHGKAPRRDTWLIPTLTSVYKETYLSVIFYFFKRSSMRFRIVQLFSFSCILKWFSYAIPLQKVKTHQKNLYGFEIFNQNIDLCRKWLTKGGQCRNF